MLQATLQLWQSWHCVWQFTKQPVLQATLQLWQPTWQPVLQPESQDWQLA